MTCSPKPMEEVTIVVPVKDEEVGLNYLLENFRASSIEQYYNINFIFVIDIRTSDSSKRIAAKFSDRIIDQKETTGKGAAVIQAIREWKKNPTPLIVFLDADGSYCFDSVKKILDSVCEGSDIVSGSRFISRRGRPEGMSRLHSFGNKSLSLISSIRNGRRISDLCTGLWGFRENSLRKMNIQSSGFDLEAEIAGLARRNRLNHTEIHVEWSQRKGGTSKLRSLIDGFRIFLRIIRT